MSPKEVQTFQQIFLKIFNPEWFDGFETSIKMDDAEAKAFGKPQLTEDDLGLDGQPIDKAIIQDTYPQAKAWFLTFWDIFKIECYRHKIILERHAAKSLCFNFIPRPDIWGLIVDEDRDFACFEDMRAKFEEEKAYQAAQQNPEEQEKIIRRREIRLLVRQNLIRSADNRLPESRLAVPFAEELEGLITALKINRIQTDPNEIATVIHHTLPHIPISLLKLLLGYKERIAAIKPHEIPEPEIVDLTDEYIEVFEDGIIHRAEPEIDPATNKLIIMEKEYTIGFNGLIEAFEFLANQDHAPMEFYDKFKALLDAVHVHCQQANILSKLIKLVYKLQEHYKEKWNRDDKTPYSFKIGFVYSGLGLKHAQLAEAMPTSFSNGSTFKCR